jgi:guanylate kinase
MIQPVGGQVIVLSGPSGVGKGALRACVEKRLSGLTPVVSVTTRSPRSGEVDGVDYQFVTPAQFAAMAAQGDLLEWVSYAGKQYGTPRAGVDAALTKGQSVLLEIEVHGALAVKKRYPEASKLVFIAPPSMAELETRLRKRNTSTESDIASRLRTAEWEMSQQNQFDTVLVNADLDTCQTALLQLLAGWLA